MDNFTWISSRTFIIPFGCFVYVSYTKKRRKNTAPKHQSTQTHTSQNSPPDSHSRPFQREPSGPPTQMMLPIRSSTAPLWRQQLAALWANTSPPVKCICIITIAGYLTSFAPGVVAALSVTPGYLLPPSFHIWTAMTFWCLEMHAWEVAVDIVTVGLCGKLIEPLWGRWEMVKFFLVVNTGVAVLTTLFYLVLYAATGDVELLFHVHVHGLAGYVAGLSVAVRQIMPDLLIFRTGAGKFTNRNVPLTTLVIGLVLWLVGLLDGTFPVMFTSGLFVSWMYLRFYQRHGISSRGDSSDSFTFASFFPNVMQPAIGCLLEPVHAFCLRIGAIKRQTHHPLIQVSSSGGNAANPNASMSSSSASSSQMGSNLFDQHDMERRRQIALKALSERLSKTTDSSRQNVLPKALPNANAGGIAGHPRLPRPVPGDGRRPFTFEVPAIPLPPPPSMATAVAPPLATDGNGEQAAAAATTTTSNATVGDLMQ